MAAPDRITIVRSAYERFNDGDLDGVLALLTDDVEWPDLVHDSVLHGKAALRRYWDDMLAQVRLSVFLGEAMEVVDHVVALVRQQVYELDHQPFGPANTVAHRFWFRDGLIARMELTELDTIPEEVRSRFRER